MGRPAIVRPWWWNRAGVYRITAPSGGFYIGSAVKLGKRWMAHKWQLKTHKHSNTPLCYASEKYGIGGLVFEVLAVTEPEHRFDLEQGMLDKHFGSERCYNTGPLARGCGSPRSKECRAKIGAIHRGKTISSEHKAQISAARTGKRRKPFSQEHRQRMSEAQTGKRLSASTREKVRQASKARWDDPKYRERMAVSMAAVRARRTNNHQGVTPA